MELLVGSFAELLTWPLRLQAPGRPSQLAAAEAAHAALLGGGAISERYGVTSTETATDACSDTRAATTTCTDASIDGVRRH